MYDDELEKRVRLLEAGQIVGDARLSELEGWRRRDEQRVAKLVQDATVAEQVKQVLEAHSARSWSLWAKLGAGISSAVVVTGGVLEILTRLGALHP